MGTEDPKERVSWRSLAPIFADVLVSPWNLLIGGLLAHNLPIEMALVSLLVGYLLLSGVMLVYGGLGLRFRKRTYAIIEPVFGKKGANYFFSVLLALGQIGWFGVISEIGGVSLAEVFHLPRSFGVICYSALMILMASLKLHQLGFMKAFIAVSSLTLIVYLLIAKGALIEVGSVLSYQPISSRSIIWGISVVFSSLISFTSVSPDFMSQAGSRSDVVSSVLLGVMLPGLVVGSLGIFLFHDFPSLQVAALIGSLALPLFGNLFNILTNSDAAVAIYTPGLAFMHILRIARRPGTLVAGTIGTVLAVSGIVRNLETWLTFLSAVYPAVIGLTLAHYFSSSRRGHLTTSVPDINWRSIAVVSIAFLGAFFIDLSVLSWLSIGLSFLLALLAQALWPTKKNKDT